MQPTTQDYIMQEPMFTTTEAAKRLGVNRVSVYRYVQRGKFPNARPKSDLDGSPILIPESDIVAFEERRRKRLFSEDD
jgi:excisionase family DNA binding protein